MEYKIYLSNKWDQVKELFKHHRKKPDFILEWSNQFKKELNLPLNVPIIMTGHQPILYYPGIFVKLILADYIAKKIKGKAYYLVLDTDKEIVEWKFIWFDNNIYYQKKIILSQTNHILLNQLLENKKKELYKILSEWSLRLYHIFEPSIVIKIQNAIQYCKEILNYKNLSISQFSVLMNHYLMKQLNLNVEPIFVSQLSKTKSFREIINYIKNNHHLFRTIYNNNLINFRKKHNIKNDHYPFSNLKEYELPFWISDGHYRKTLTIEDKIGNDIFPKAITLSMCIRIFLAELMIHGTGGGFYDLVSNEILKEFFQIEPSPHIVTTATIPTQPKASIPLENESTKEILWKLRKWKFNPEMFVNDTCQLKRKKIYLIHLKNYYDSIYKKNIKNYFYNKDILKQIDLEIQFKELINTINKNPSIYGELIHQEFLKLNHKIQLYSLKVKKTLEKQLQKSKMVQYNQSIFFDRTYPAFYYNLEELKEELIKKFTED